MNIGGRNWDRKLRDEERRLTKLLDELSAKTDLRLDSAGLPLIPSAPSVHASTQTEAYPDYADEEDTVAPYATASHHSNGAAAPWDKLVFEQMHHDLSQQLAQRDEEIESLKKHIEEYEDAVVRLLQWKNSMANHVALLLHSHHRVTSSHQRQHAASAAPGAVPPAPSGKSGSAQPQPQSQTQQQRLLRLHDRILQIATEDVAVPPPCAHLAQAPLKLAQKTTSDAERRQKLDRFSNYYHDYDLVAPRAAAGHDKAAAGAAAAGSVGGHRGVRVLLASEDEICGYTFDLLLRLQATVAEFRDVPERAAGGQSRDVASSVTLRHFLLILLALEAFDDAFSLADAVDAFQHVAHRHGAPPLSRGTPPQPPAGSPSAASSVASAQDDEEHGARRMNYLEFVQALELSASSRSKTLLKTSRAAASSAASAAAALQGVGAFINSWAARLDRFVADFDFFQRVAAACYPATHPVVVRVLTTHQALLVPQALRHMNYGVVRPQKTANLSAAQAVGLGATGFEVFCINHDVVPQLLPSSAVRRVAQFGATLFSSQRSHAFVLSAVVLLAQYLADLRHLPDAPLSGTAAASPKRTPGAGGARIDRAQSQQQQALQLLPIVEDVLARVLRNVD